MRKPQHQHISLPTALTASPAASWVRSSPKSQHTCSNPGSATQEGTCSPQRGDGAPGAADSGDQGDCASGPTEHLLPQTTASRPGDVADIPTTQKQTQLDRMRR